VPVKVVLDSSRHSSGALRRPLKTLAAAAMIVLGLIASVLLFPVGVLVFAVVSGAAADGELPASDAQIIAAAIALIVIMLGGRRGGLRLLRENRELVLFLRRFGHDDATSVTTFAAEQTIGKSWRLVTLDDAKVAPLGVSARTARVAEAAELPERISDRLKGLPATDWVIWIGLLPWVICAVCYALEEPLPPYVFEAAIAVAAIFLAGCFVYAVVVFVSNMLQLLLMPVISAGRAVLGHVREAEQAKLRRIEHAQEIDAVAEKLVAESRRFFAPRLVVLTVSSEVWQPTVTRLAMAGALTIIDVSEPTPNLIWEIRELSDRLGPRCVFIGESSRMAQLTSVAEGAAAAEPLVEQLAFLLDGEQVLAYTTDPKGMQRFARALRGELLAAAEQFAPAGEQAPRPPVAVTPAGTAVAARPQHTRMQEELVAYDDVIARYGEADEQVLRERAVNALVDKGRTLAELGQPAQALAVFDDVVNRYGRAPELREHVAEAMVNRGVVLGALDRVDEEIACYDEVVARYGEDDEPAARAVVADALVNKGVALSELERGDEELAAYGEVVARLGDAPQPALREKVAGARAATCATLGRLGRHDESLAAADDVVARHGSATDPALRRHVADALASKIAALVELGRVDEALASEDAAAARDGIATDPALQARVADALLAKGTRLDELGREQEARDVYEAVIARYSMASSAGTKALAAHARVESGTTARGIVLALVSHTIQIKIKNVWKTYRSTRVPEPADEQTSATE
jgi:tetratricopeptide (TPR) repeat protein